jgi:type IV secretory pathway TraG/TraD family ATPase VirD4
MNRDQTANLLLTLIVAACAAGGVLWLAAHAAARLVGADRPEADPISGVWALVNNPGDPAAAWHTDLGAVAYWAVVAALVAVAAAVAVLLWRATRPRGPRRETDPHHLVGLPTGRAAVRTAGVKPLLARAEILRPSFAEMKRVRPEQVGYRIGRVGRRDVWLSVEDSLLVLGPPRSGKGMNTVVPMILEAPGAVVTTSLFTDNIALTMRQRAKRGPVAVFAPSLGKFLPSAMRWSPIRGCDQPDTAQLRATALAAGTSRGVENASFWRDKTIQALYPMLHAAAISGATTADFDRWCSGPALAEEAVTILRDHPRAVPGWADKLAEIINADPRTRDNMWAGVQQATKSLSNPNVLDACSPRAGEQFDPARFLAESGTLYVVGDDKGVDGPLVAALIEDIFAAAKHIANTSPGNRLDPPLLLMLDEAANIAYLPSLPTMVSAGGGRGVTTVNVWQSRAQARDRWGSDAERAIWGASTVKLVLGGLSDAQDLGDLSTLVGTREERTDTASVNGDGTRSTSSSWREVPIMRPEQIHTMPKGVALMVHPGQQPALVDLIPYTKRPYGEQLATDRDAITALLRGDTDPDVETVRRTATYH